MSADARLGQAAAGPVNGLASHLGVGAIEGAGGGSDSVADAGAVGRRRWLGWGCACALAPTGWLAQPAQAQGVVLDQSDLARLWQAGQRPDPVRQPDEAALWSAMDQREARLRRLPWVEPDVGLNRLLGEALCALGAGHCPQLRVLVLRLPEFYAAMAPNGLLQISTGMLLRLENPAQLATVMGHELAHYLLRHWLAKQLDDRERAESRARLSWLGPLAGVGKWGLQMEQLAFSREHEAQADRLGLRIMREHGHDPAQAPRMWANLADEYRAMQPGDGLAQASLLSSHPAPVDRQRELGELARALGPPPPGPALPSAQAFDATWARLREGWLADALRHGRPAASLVVFERLLARQPGDPSLRWARAELRRQRAEPGDWEAALQDLNWLQTQAPQHAAGQRCWAELQLALGQSTLARQGLLRYLQLAPQAPDAPWVRHRLAGLP